MRLGWVLAALTLTAGCFGSDPRPTDPSEDPADATASPAPFVAAHQMEACYETGVVFLVDFAQAQKNLPKGFKAADAQTLLDSPNPFNKAAVLLTAARCDRSSMNSSLYDEGAVAVTIEPPNVAGPRAQAHNLYEFGRATTIPEHRQALEKIGWNQIGEQVTVNFGRTSVGSVALPYLSGRGGIADATGAVYEFTIDRATPSPASLKGIYRWWQATPAGIAYFDYTFTADTNLGPAACTLRSDGWAQKVVGVTRCSDGMAMGVVTPAFGFKFEQHFLGNVTLG